MFMKYYVYVYVYLSYIFYLFYIMNVYVFSVHSHQQGAVVAHTGDEALSYRILLPTKEST